MSLDVLDSDLEKLVGSTLDLGQEDGGAPAGMPPSVRRYAILAHLGEGGMGTVFTAHDARLDRKVAIKVLRRADSAHARARFQREARALARLSHPNVVAVYDAGEVGDHSYLAMELVDGSSLRQWLADAPRPWREVVAVFLGAGRGLAAAHDAGLVHRDVKPDNILVARDGSARIADFGLARLTSTDDAEPESAGPERSPDWPALTRDDAMVGTPRYMAPERQLDARSDQFGFCVSLREALEPDRAPAFVRRVIERGTRPDPAARYPSMYALLRDLGRDPARRRRLVALGAVTVAVAAGAAMASARLAVPGEACAAATQRLPSVWSDARRRELAAAFAGTALPYAADTASRVAERVGAYTADWAAMRRDACEATAVRHEQSETLLDLRMACLDRRLDALEALLAVLARADASLVNRAAVAVSGLEPLAGCADAQALTAAVPPPADPAARARVAALQARLDHVKALHAAGRYQDERPLAGPLADEAEREGHAPLVAAARFAQAQAEEAMQEDAAAEATLRKVLAPAARAHDDALAGRAWSELILVVGGREKRRADALALVDAAAAAVVRAGDPPSLRAQLLHVVGMTHLAHGDFALAHEQLAQAVALLEATPGRDADVLAQSLGKDGVALANLGKQEEALARYERALALLEGLYGPVHPKVAGAHGNIANMLSRWGRYDEAAERYRRAREVFERAEGPDGADVALVVHNLGVQEAERGRNAEARAALLEALALYEKHFGPEHEELAYTLQTLTSVSTKLGAFADAERYGRRTLAIREKTFGPDHPEVAKALIELALLDVAAGRPAAGLPLMDRALAIHRAVDGGAVRRAEVLAARGEVLVALHRLDEAAADLRQALELRERQAPDGILPLAEVLEHLGACEAARGHRAQAAPLLARAATLRARLGH